jgi:hypothetical protein
MQASVVGVCLQSAESLATSRQKRGVYTTCLPRLKLQCAHSNGQRQRLTQLPDTRIESQAGGVGRLPPGLC